MKTKILYVTLMLLFLGALGFIGVGGLVCTGGDPITGDCITIWNAGSIHLYDNQGGNLKFSVDGNNGDVNTAGGYQIKGTPIAVGTAIPTATPLSVGGIITATVVSAATFVANGTPVIPFSTPQPTYAYVAPTADGTKLDKSGGTITGALVITDTLSVTGVITSTGISVNATPAFWVTPIPTPTAQIGGGLYEVCGSDTITGTGTIAHGLATPSYITAGLAADATGDGVRVTWTNASAVVTLKVWNSALTPAPNTTPVAVDWCAKGIK